MKLLLSILLISLLIAAQDKYLVYFADKGITETEFLSKQDVYKLSNIELSEHAIERRRKVLGENYIQFIDLPINDSYVSQLRTLGVKIINQLKWFNAISARLTSEQIVTLSQLDFISKIEKVKTFRFTKPNQNSFLDKRNNFISDYNFDYGNSLAQNELHDIPQVHNAGFFGQGTIIGILDSGFDWKDHPALMNLNVLYEYDYIQGDPFTRDSVGDPPGQDWHGTSVFSIGFGFDEGELIGPGYGASFYLAKTDDISSETRVDEDNFAAAVEDFESMGVDIITASLGYSIFDTPEESYTYEDMNGNTTLAAQAYNYAYDLGVVTVAAAGNEGQTDWHYILSPADAFNVISVGNVQLSGKLNPSSSRGPTADGRIKPEVLAMGTGNYHAVPGGGYNGFGSGTSFGAPMVAGMIGQLLSAYPYLTNDQVRSIVLHSGDNFETPNNDMGYGLMSAIRVLNFPNIHEYDAGKFSINKLFIGIPHLTNLKLHFRISGGTWNEEVITPDDNGFAVFNLPEQSQANDDVTFYYTYSDSSGSLVRLPIDMNYDVKLSENKVGFVTSVINEPDEIVNDFMLYQNYPNPFNPSTTIDFQSPVNTYARITIYNVLGQKIKTLYSGRVTEGLTRFSWNGTDDLGNKVASGTYFYSAEIKGKVISKKMMLLK